MTTSLMSPPQDAIYFGSRDAVVCSKRRSWLVRARLRLFMLMFDGERNIENARPGQLRK
ncbi:MAG: hypothetical protein WAV38_30300 [Xanthobacteraceae bacterium]